MKDKQIEKLIKAEEGRQKKMISLIASENYVSADVLTALGSKFTNKHNANERLRAIFATRYQQLYKI